MHQKSRHNSIIKRFLLAFIALAVISLAVLLVYGDISPEPPTPKAVSQTPSETLSATEKPTASANNTSDEAPANSNASQILDPSGATIQTRFNPPEGYTRISVSQDSFAQYLRDLPLKADGEPVLLFDGSEKGGNAHIAVIDQTISDRDLHQCADAIMRLRAQYLLAQERYDEIAFHFVDGFLCEYSKWRAGNRVKFQDDKPYWKKTADSDTSEEAFQKYLEIVYAYASTLSLEKELVSIDAADMQIGDVFIIGGSPGHAVIVVDMAENSQGDRYFMLAQSYMPAQQTHVLRNPNDDALSPWYPLDFGETLYTPQWTCSRGDLKRFP